MKKLLLLSCLLFSFLTASFAQADAISSYFDKYLEDERFTVVYVSGKMFNMISKLDSEDEDFEDVREVTEKLKGLRVLITDEDAYELYREAKSKINTKKEYELLMTIRTKKGNRVEFVVKEDGDKIDELLLISGGKDHDFVLMSFVGDIDLDKISKLSNAIEMDGIENLEELKNRIPLLVWQFLETQNFHKVLVEIKNKSKTYGKFQKHFYSWFDGFKLMKYAHFSRDHFYPNESMEYCISWLFKNAYHMNPPKDLADALLMLREIDGKGDFRLGYHSY